MTSPKRLLETEPADRTGALQRELLSSLAPPREAREIVWQRVAAHAGLTAAVSSAVAALTSKAAASVGPSMAPPLAAAATSAATTSTMIVVKIGLVLIAAAPVLGSAFYLSRSGSETSLPSPSANIRTAGTPKPVSAAEATRAPISGPAEPAMQDAPIDVESASPSAKTKTRQQNALLEENRLLREARAAARAGDARQALATLRTLERRFPSGALTEERELLRIQTLSASGSHDEAAARAQRFLKLYPRSPYAAHVIKFAEPGTR